MKHVRGEDAEIAAEGEAGVKQFVVQAVSQAGGNPCPPIIVGVGLGGTMEQAALLAKRALFRPMGSAAPRTTWHAWSESCWNW